jgi:hypothetical protein
MQMEILEKIKIFILKYSLEIFGNFLFSAQIVRLK